MNAIDPDMLERILGRLPTDEGMAVSAALETPSNARQRRLDARDALIRLTLSEASGASLTARAAAFERRVRRALNSNADDEVARRFLQLNEGQILDWSSLCRIARSGRNPCKNTNGIVQLGWSTSADEPA